jgi:hypothetical protein
MGELADAIRAEIDPQVSIVRKWDPTGTAQRYHSDDSSWQEWAAVVSLEPMDLVGQIEAVARGLRSTRA